MSRFVLGLDTSCYTTSCALVHVGSLKVNQVRKMLPVKHGQRGLRQSEAVFAHIRQLPEALEELMKAQPGTSIVAVCASEKPLDHEESYMPVFQAGTTTAKALASCLQVPCYLTTHQRGHLAAALIGQETVPLEYLALHLSGGSTQLLQVSNEEVVVLGGTSDISAGQLIDRVGVALGSIFPAGPTVESWAMGQSACGRYPAICKNGEISFSGMEAAAMRDIADRLPKEQVAVEIFDGIVRSVLKLLFFHAQEEGTKPLLITGGVATSTLFEAMLTTRAEKQKVKTPMIFSQKQYAGDNAAGVAMIGLQRYLKEEQHG